MKRLYIWSFIVMMLNSYLYGAGLVANAGEDKTLTISSSNKAVHLDGAKSSSADGIVSYKWYEDDKYIGSGKSRWYALSQSGEHVITLKVVDETGETAEDKLIITVVNGNDIKPSTLKANAGKDKILKVSSSHNAVHLDGTQSSSADGIVSYKWYEGNKYIGAGKSRWYLLTQSGEHVITLKVLDGTGKKAEDSVTITVLNGDEVAPTPTPTPTPIKLKANAGEDKILMVTSSHKAVHLDGSKSSSENKIVSYKWYEGDKYIGAGQSRWYVLTKNGKHTITLKVEDSIGAVVEDNVTVRVVSQCDEATAITRDELIEMINNDEDVTEVNTCKITDMSFLFSPYDSEESSFAGKSMRMFNQDISGWDTRNVTNMSYMFNETNFNQPIGDWDVSKVTTMLGMFSSNKYFNQPLANWDVSNVTNMENLFFNADAFNQPIGNWDISNVTTMYGMFAYTDTFNQPIKGWDVSHVGNMGFMFNHTKAFNQAIDDWDVSNVRDMTLMFNSTTTFNQNIKAWDVGNVKLHHAFTEDASLQSEYNPFMN